MGGSAPRQGDQGSAESTSFVDRRTELAFGRRLLAGSRLVTLTGPGGVGKTRLAARLADRVRRTFPDGVRFVHLSGLDDPALVPLAAADALGLHDHTDRPPLDALAERLGDRRLLLVVDNCEHLLTACAELTAALLDGTPQVRVLATSRHRLGLTGEHLLELRPLPVPDPDGDLSDADRHPALALFADRAAAVVPGFRLTPDNRASVARLCRRLDGLPLAIELAAGRLRDLGLDQLMEDLDNLDDHHELRATVDWSHELCTEQEQLTWARASVLAGGFDLETAEAVCADGERLRGADVVAAVTGLVDKSVLTSEPASGVVRYRLLDTLRHYGLDRLRAQPGEEIAVRRRQRDWMQRRASADEQAWFGPGQREIVARLRADQDNLRAALDFGLTARRGEGLAALGEGLAVPGECGVVPTGCSAAPGGCPAVSRECSAAPGEFPSVTGGPAAAPAERSAASGDHQVTSDDRLAGRGECGVVPGGCFAAPGMRPAVSRECSAGPGEFPSVTGGPAAAPAERSAASGDHQVTSDDRLAGRGECGVVPGGCPAVSRECSAAPGEFPSVTGGPAATPAEPSAAPDDHPAAPAKPSAASGDHPATPAHPSAAPPDHPATPDDRLAALRLAGTLWFYWHACGAPREGRHWLERALDANPEPTPERARALWIAGLLAAVTRDLVHGRRLAEEARALAHSLGDEAEVAHADYVFGVITLFLDDLPTALTHFEAARARGRVPGQHLSLVGLDRVELACALGFLGEAERAVAVCEEARLLCERHGEEWVHSYVLRMLALAHTVQRDWPAAERHARHALRLKLAVHDVTGIALTLDLLARIATETGAHDHAALVLGGADRVWSNIDRDRWGSAALNKTRRDSERRAREALGEAAYERAYRHGGELELTELVGRALEERRGAREHAGGPKGCHLTPRESQVADLVAQGLANHQIADRLVIARRTAEGHVERILGKLGLNNRSQLAAWVTARR